MNNLFKRTLLLCFLLCFTLNTQLYAGKSKSKVDEIIGDYLSAIGGVKKIKKILNYHSTGVFYMGDKQFSYVYYTSERNKLSLTLKSKDVYDKTVFEDNIITSRSQDSIFVTKADLIKLDYELNCWLLPLAYCEELVHELKYVKEHNLNGVIQDEVYVKFKNGVEWNVFFNQETHLIDKKVMSSGLTLTQSNYKKVDGVLYPFKFDFNFNNQFYSRLFLDNIETNVEIPASTYTLK